MKKVFIVLSIFMMAAFVLLLVRSRFNEDSIVSVVTATRGTIVSSIKATGKVDGDRNATICAPMPARVVRINAAEGQFVSRGAVLAVLDDREAEAQTSRCRAKVGEIREKVEQSRMRLDGLRKVYGVGGTSLQSLKDGESELNALLEAKKQAEGEARSAAILLEDTRIKAPFSGVVTRKGINVGEWASPGDPLFSLADSEKREIEVMVEESDAGLIAVGQEVEITCEAVPGTVWNEKILSIDPAVRKDGNTSSISVRVSLDGNSQNLRFGQQVDAKILTARRADVVMLPFDALMSKNGKTFVAFVREGLICFKPVVTGIESSTHVEIKEGLDAGLEVVLPEGTVLREGEPVREVRRESNI